MRFTIRTECANNAEVMWHHWVIPHFTQCIKLLFKKKWQVYQQCKRNIKVLEYVVRYFHTFDRSHKLIFAHVRDKEVPLSPYQYLHYFLIVTKPPLKLMSLFETQNNWVMVNHVQFVSHETDRTANKIPLKKTEIQQTHFFLLCLHLVAPFCSTSLHLCAVPSRRCKGSACS